MTWTFDFSDLFHPRTLASTNVFDQIFRLQKNIHSVAIKGHYQCWIWCLALQRVVRENVSDKVTFIIMFDPRLPSVSQIVKKHFEVMRFDPHLNRVFESGAQVAYSRYKNINDLICRSTLYPIKRRPTREQVGWRVCSKQCVACIYSNSMTQFKCTSTGITYKIKNQIGCDDKNVIYLIQCKKCNEQYIGKTSGVVKLRLNKHRTSIGQSVTNVAKHFELPGHSVRDFLPLVLKEL